MVPPLLVLVLALFVFGGLQTYTMTERRQRVHWRRIERAPNPEREEPFRRLAAPPTTRPVLGLERAPATIRHTALWSFYMGQMAIPGGLLALFGLMFGGLGLVGVPGMILAVRIYLLGFKLLRRDPGAEREARTLARFAVILNVVLIALGFVLAVATEGELLPLLAILVPYGAVSFAHATAMRRCADILAEDRLIREATAAAMAAEATAHMEAEARLR